MKALPWSFVLLCLSTPSFAAKPARFPEPKLPCASWLHSHAYAFLEDEEQIRRVVVLDRYRYLFSNLFRGAPTEFLSPEIKFRNLGMEGKFKLRSRFYTQPSLSIVFDNSLKMSLAFPLVHAVQIQRIIDRSTSASPKFNSITSAIERDFLWGLNNFSAKAHYREFEMFLIVYLGESLDVLGTDPDFKDEVETFKKHIHSPTDYIAARLHARFYNDSTRHEITSDRLHKIATDAVHEILAEQLAGK